MRLARSPSCSAPPPAPRTGRSPTPAPPSRCCTACSNASATSACRASRSCSRWPATPLRTGRRERQRRNRHLAEGVPSAPGVYLFRGARDEVLYVGTSGDLQRRVRSYFTAGERRRRIRDMVAQAERVDTIVCAHALEAGVRELRLIAAHRPRYNRRSRNPNASWWVAATAEAFPRLSVVSTPRDGALGPFRSQRRRDGGRRHRARRRPAAAVHAAHPGPRTPPPGPCALYELHRCAAPCAGLPGRRRVRPGRGDLARPRPRRATTRRCRPSPTRSPRLAARRAVRVGRPAARPRSPDWCGRWAGPSGSRRSPGSPRWSAPARTAAVAGSWPWCATAGSPRPGSPAAACRRCPWSTRCAPAPPTVLPGPGPLRGATAEEVRLLHGWLTAGGTRLVRCHAPWDRARARCRELGGVGAPRPAGGGPGGLAVRLEDTR